MLSKSRRNVMVLAIASLAVMLMTALPLEAIAQQGQQGSIPPALRAAIATGNPDAVQRAIATLSGGNEATFVRLSALAVDGMVERAIAQGQNPAPIVELVTAALVRAAATNFGPSAAAFTAQNVGAHMVSLAYRLRIEPTELANAAVSGSARGATQAGVDSNAVVASAIQGVQQRATSLGVEVTVTATTGTTGTTGTTETSATTDTTATTATTLTTLTTLSTLTTFTTITTVTTMTTVTTSFTTTTIASPSAGLPLELTAGPRS